MKKTLTVLTTLALTAIASIASAQEVVSVQVAAGPALSLRAPHDCILTHSRYELGGGGQADVLFSLGRNFAVGPSAAVVMLQQSKQNLATDIMWTFGGTARLQGSHNASIVPYIQGTFGVSKEFSIYNPGLTSEVGVNFAVNEEHSNWVGLFGAFQHTFDSSSDPSKQTALINHFDSNVAIAGLSLSFDAPNPRHHSPVVQTAQTERVVEKQVEVPVPVFVQVSSPDDGAAALQSESVLFTKDSFALSADATALLDKLAAGLTANPTYNVVLEGYASAEGDTVHNLVLSNNRALAARDYLVSKGIDTARVHPVAFGETGEANDAANRRVDLIAVRLVKASKE